MCRFFSIFFIFEVFLSIVLQSAASSLLATGIYFKRYFSYRLSICRSNAPLRLCHIVLTAICRRHGYMVPRVCCRSFWGGYPAKWSIDVGVDLFFAIFITAARSTALCSRTAIVMIVFQVFNRISITHNAIPVGYFAMPYQRFYAVQRYKIFSTLQARVHFFAQN